MPDPRPSRRFRLFTVLFTVLGSLLLPLLLSTAWTGGLRAQQAVTPYPANDLQILQPQLSVPGQVRATYSGPLGADNWSYWVVASYVGGSSGLSQPANLTNVGPLSGTNTVSIDWQRQTGATGYVVLRSPRATQPANGCACVVATVAGSVGTATDTGAALGNWTEGAIGGPTLLELSVNNRDYANPRLIHTLPRGFWDRDERDYVWKMVGAGTLAQRPATCTERHDVYVCAGAGCGIAPDNLELDYCTAPNVWTPMAGGAGSAGYDTVEDEGIALPQRTILNIIGPGSTCVDNAPDTDCTFTGAQANWSVAGAGTLAQRPATCTANQDAFICNGTGCGVTPEFLETFYCTATDTWSSLAAGGDTLQFFNVINEGPIINLPATCNIGDVFVCNGAGCRGNFQLEIYYCTSLNNFESLPGADVRQYAYYQAAGCQGGSAASGFNLPVSNFPAATCITFDTNKTAGFLAFDATTDESVFGHFQLPVDWTGTVDLQLFWFAAATTGNVVWAVQTNCLGAAEQYSDITWNAAGTVTAAAQPVSNDFSVSSISPVNVSGCVGGETLFWWFYRDANAGGDTMAGDANLISLRMSFSEAQ